MTDDRPRPQFGEYASREEQLARIQTPSTEQLEPTPARDTAPASSSVPQGVDPRVVAASRARFNLVGTIVLLVYGFIEVVMNTPTFISLNILINDQLTVLGDSLGTEFDPYQPTSATGTAGIALVALWVALWVGAVLWSWRRVRAQKSAIWIPIVAGAIANIVAGVVITLLVFADPVIASQVIDAVQQSGK